MRNVLIVLAAAALAGCTGGPAGGGFGAYFAVNLNDAGACTAIVPYPVVDGAAWEPLERQAGSGTTARLLESEFGPGLELVGDGDIGAVAEARTTEMTPAALSLPQQPFTPNGTVEEGTYWVHADGCEGAAFNLVWVYDDGADGVRIGLDGNLTAGWQEVPAVRSTVAGFEGGGLLG